MMYNHINSKMDREILTHYLQYSQFTYPGLYEQHLKRLPDDIKTLGLLIRKQLIHRTTLELGKVGVDATHKDIQRIPKFRQAEDDNLTSVVSLIAELIRRDDRGFVEDRKPENKLIVTCRFTAILVASALKAKSIPSRVRSGYAPYFPNESVSSDHWINEYWNQKQKRWVIIDVDGSGHDTGYNMFDLPKTAFDYPAVAWLNCRAGKDNPNRFFNAKPARGLKVVGWAVFYDFHCLMNNEIIYLHNPSYLYKKWGKITEKDMKEIDELAKLMTDPDKNFDELVKIWGTKKKFRMLKGGLL